MQKVRGLWFLSAVALTVLSAEVLAAPAWLDSAVAAENATTIEMRRHLHATPELGNQEKLTQAYIAQKLKEYGVDEVLVGFKNSPTAVIGVINPNKKHAIGLRADIDALPIKENTGLSFASKAKGVMWGKSADVSHMCGHDMHMAMLLSAAKILAVHKAEVPRKVVLVFQPAEEGDSITNPFTADKPVLSGAKALVEGGLMEKFGIEQMYGIHVMARAPAGEMLVAKGTALNSADAFQIDVEGKQAHGAMPWTGTDATLAAAQTVVALQQIVSRNVNLTQGMGVITVGKLQAGETGNVMAGKASMLGTIRANHPEIRSKLLERIPQVAEGTAEAAGAVAKTKLIEIYPVTRNDPQLVERTVKELVDFGVKAKISDWNPGASEDFSFYTQKVPSVFMFLGSDAEGVKNAPNNHSDKFSPDESAMQAGVRAHIAAAMSPVAQ